MPQIGHEGEEESDIFTIREVSFQPTGEADWKDTNYTLNTDSLDWVGAAKGHRGLSAHLTGCASAPGLGIKPVRVSETGAALLCP